MREDLSMRNMETIEIVVKITSLLSYLSSAWIIQHIARDRRKRKLVYHRMILGMSISDLSASFWLFIGSWAVPSGTLGVYQAWGNDVTCSMQGFFTQLGVVTPIYNSCLSLYYVLVVKYNYNESSFRAIQPYFHLVAWGWGLSTSVAGAALDLYQVLYQKICFIAAEEGNTEPHRNDVAIALYSFTFFHIPIWTAIIFSTVAMVMIYTTIRRAEQEGERLGLSSSQANGAGRNVMSKKTARQASLYVLAFFISFLFPTLFRLARFSVGGTVHYLLGVAIALFFPLQGFLNFIVYTEKAYSKLSQEYPESSTAWKIRSILFNDARPTWKRKMSSFNTTRHQSIFNDSKSKTEKVSCSQTLQKSVVKDDDDAASDSSNERLDQELKDASDFE